MTVKKRMIVAFGILIALIVGVAVFGASRINSIQKSTTNLYEHPYKVNLAVADIRFVLSECQSEIRNVVYGDQADAKAAAANIKNHGEIIEQNFKIIESQFLADKTIYKDFLAKSKNLQVSYDWILQNAQDEQETKKEFTSKTKLFYTKVQDKLDEFSSFAKGKGKEFYESSVEKKKTTVLMFYITSAIIVLLSIALALINIKAITNPLNYAKKSAEEIATGNLNAEFNTDRPDEIGDLLRSIQKIVNNIKKANHFTLKIGEGEYDTAFEAVGENDTLGHSLLEMKEQLKKVAQEDEKRNWSTRGLAIFAEILRSDTNNLNAFGQRIISELIGYLKANQGGIFLLNDADESNPKMELISAYAYDREKFLTKEINPGEGLVGQSWVEGESIFMKKLPQDYVTITSGLGDATPNCLLIVPLKENEDIYGMVEIASFSVFEEHEVEFLERLAQSIGATFKNLKTNIQTNKLLQESNEMSDMMRQQEEELRQNNEEMQATAEQVHQEAEKHKAEMDLVIKELNARLNILDEMCLVSETNKKGEIQKVNSKFREVAQYTNSELIGQPHNIVRHPDMPAAAWKAAWATIGKGQPFRAVVKNKAKDGSAYWVDVVIAPKLGEDGKPDGYLGVRYDITDQIMKFDTYTMKIGDEEFTIPTK